MDELFSKDKEHTDGVDEPAPKPSIKLQEEPKNALDLAEKLLVSVATAKIGFIVFSHYAARFQLKDKSPITFRVFLLLAYFFDFVVAICVVAIVLWLLIGVVYATLRGLNVVEPTNHIIRVIIDGIK